MANKKGIKLETIIKLYSSGLNTAQIAEQLGCGHGNISLRLKKAGITIKRDYSNRRLPSRVNKHQIDETFFDCIDSEAKAYFLGLMFSDGSVSKNQFYLKLKDEDIILKFRDVLKCDYPVRSIEIPYKAYILTVSSQTLCTSLSKLGCVPNKTRVIKLPKLRNDLYRHFIRGFFDGDGCLQLQDKKYHCRFDLTSASKEFLEQVRPLITAHAKTNGHLGKETKYDVWHLNYTGHQVQQILDWLYESSNFYLQRKYTKYKLLSSL